VGLLAAAGCATPRRSPVAVSTAPRLEPPPAREDRLDRERVLALARAPEGPAQAIEVLDRHAFAFELDAESLRWFGEQGVDPQVHDYLRKRSRVDWEALRGDLDRDRQ
jgi:hypothetical protein